MLAITAGAFDPTAFVTQARQLAMFADGYADLGIDTTSAVAWADHGFMPNEARPWIDNGFTPERASIYAGWYWDPTEAARVEALRVTN